jgi:hypothetical protein
MNLPRVVVDNSAILPAFFPEVGDKLFDSGLVTNRSRALVQAIRTRRVKAYVPPSFFREFLHTATFGLSKPGGWNDLKAAEVRAQWDELIALKLIAVPLDEIIDHSAILTFQDRCPATDSWYVAAAVHARAEFWMSHEHKDGLVTVASKHIKVRLLSTEAPSY